ncbi:MAG: hypothetical protein EXS14_01565 [Planctomycetes bacterium]|nr:hypothetical protein [Planctomycetota bacterium]
MRCFIFFIVFVVSAPAQVALLNSAIAPPSLVRSTVGSGITLDYTVPFLGGGCAARASTAANLSYLPTGVALTPSAGFTIQFHYRPWAAQNFGYIFGDGVMVSPLTGYSGGRFRMFQSGACYCPAYTPTNSAGLTLRGVPNEVAVTGGPLLSMVNANGWVHIAVRYSPTTNIIDIFMNGISMVSVQQTAGPFNWNGTELDFMGDRASTTLAAQAQYDDIRIYPFARSTADIQADWQIVASGMGPSGLPNTPPTTYFECDFALNNHEAVVGVNGDAPGHNERRITAGTGIGWGGDCLTLPGTPASCLINIWPGGTNPNCITPGFPAVELGHNFSLPGWPLALIVPDGLGLSALGVAGGLLLPYTYSGTASPLMLTTALGGGLLVNGDRIALQFVAPDPTSQGFIGSSNVCTMRWADALPGDHAHVEARGSAAIQVFGFHEMRNTGSTAITSVTINCLPLGAGVVGFSPAGALNSGGSLFAGSSYRNGTEVFTGLAGTAPGLFTGTNPFATTVGGLAATAYSTLSFTFTSFDATIDELVWDCDLVPNNSVGSVLIGATVSVTFASGVTLTGTLVADPLDPFAAQIDL